MERDELWGKIQKEIDAITDNNEQGYLRIVHRVVFPQQRTMSNGQKQVDIHRAINIDANRSDILDVAKRNVSEFTQTSSNALRTLICEDLQMPPIPTSIGMDMNKTLT